MLRNGITRRKTNKSAVFKLAKIKSGYEWGNVGS